LAVAKENKLDVELVETKPPVKDIEYFKLNPLGRVPTFVGANGYILTETMAIAVYCTSNSNLVSVRPHIYLAKR
jgi:elongation factor 1-gamma